MNKSNKTIASKATIPDTGLSKAPAKGQQGSRVTHPSPDKLLCLAATTIDCTTDALQAWFDQSPDTPPGVVQNGLRLISRYHLNPFDDEIAISRYDDGHWQAVITMEGWSRIINAHPAFSGICFTESPEQVGGIPIWMGCAIYRNDRILPIEVKEYACEVQTQHASWQEMPRRMLRQRVIAQCAQLAFGVSVPKAKGGGAISLKAKSAADRSQATKRTLVEGSRREVLREWLGREKNST